VASELRALQAQHVQQKLFAQPHGSAPDAAAAAAEAADLADSKRARRAPVRLADELAASAAGTASSSADGAGGVTPEAVQRLYETHFTFTTLTASDGVVRTQVGLYLSGGWRPAFTLCLGSFAARARPRSRAPTLEPVVRPACDAAPAPLRVSNKQLPAPPARCSGHLQPRDGWPAPWRHAGCRWRGQGSV
jgi:hypothetical protein